MGRGGRGSPAPRRPVDLTGAISSVERNDLVTLINAITEKLHNDISIIFDSPPVTPILGDQDIGHHQLLALSLRNTKENANPKLSSQVKRATQVPQPGSKVAGSGEKEDEEITPQLRELKKEALLFYRKWQTIALQRFRDLSVMEANAPQTNIRGRGRGSARGVRGGRAGRGGRGGRGGLTVTTGKSETETTGSYTFYKTLFSTILVSLGI